VQLGRAEDPLVDLVCDLEAAEDLENGQLQVFEVVLELQKLEHLVEPVPLEADLLVLARWKYWRWSDFCSISKWMFHFLIIMRWDFWMTPGGRTTRILWRIVVASSVLLLLDSRLLMSGSTSMVVAVASALTVAASRRSTWLISLIHNEDGSVNKEKSIK
jgi:hypothetical protein